MIHLYFFTPKTNATQAAIKATPPIGVIAPNHVIPVNDNIYKLPEKIRIPSTINTADHFNQLVSSLLAKAPKISRPNP